MASAAGSVMDSILSKISGGSTVSTFDSVVDYLVEDEKVSEKTISELEVLTKFILRSFCVLPTRGGTLDVEHIKTMLDKYATTALRMKVGKTENLIGIAQEIREEYVKMCRKAKYTPNLY